MKKTLVALAALATVGAAFAQSSVTLYGKIDWEVVSKRTTAVITGVRTNPGIKVDSAGLSGSRWGMKGSEDLGGGMSAIFDLQGGFNIDDATTAQGGAGGSWQGTVQGLGSARIFGRTAMAGLKGGFGQISAGRQYAPYDNAFGAVDAQGYTSNSAMGAVFAAGIHADGNGPGRIDNQLTYYTPAMGGFNAQLSWAPGENGVAGGASAGRYTGIGLGYGNGPLNIQFAQESFRVGPGGSSTDAWLIGASYDFGVAKPFIAYERAENPANTQDRGWSLGVSVPVGPATFALGWARETSNPVVGATSTVKGIGAQVVYPLSKRTNVYAEFMNVSIDSGIAGAIDGKNRRFGVGMRHDF